MEEEEGRKGEETREWFSPLPSIHQHGRSVDQWVEFEWTAATPSLENEQTRTEQLRYYWFRQRASSLFYRFSPYHSVPEEWWLVAIHSSSLLKPVQWKCCKFLVLEKRLGRGRILLSKVHSLMMCHCHWTTRFHFAKSHSMTTGAPRVVKLIYWFVFAVDFWPSVDDLQCFKCLEKSNTSKCKKKFGG